MNKQYEKYKKKDIQYIENTGSENECTKKETEK